MKFIPPELATLVDRPPGESGWTHEIKFDGYRIQAIVEGRQATLWSRRGLDWSARFPEIAAEACKLSDCQIDGEVVAITQAGLSDFSALQEALSTGRTGGLVYFVFDLLAEPGTEWRRWPLAERKVRLAALLGERKESRIRLVDHFETAGTAVLESACRLSLEGVVSKKLDAPYLSGRSSAWLKSKCRGREEFVVGGYAIGKNGQLGALLAGLPGRRGLRYVGKVGTGYSQATGADLLRRLKALAATATPFVGAQPDRLREVRWARPQLVAEVEYTGYTADGLLRHAVFKGLREDKGANEVGKDRPEAAKPARARIAPRAKTAAARTASSTASRRAATADVVTLTHPDKLLWPDDGITKRDLADYFARIGDKLFSFIVDRPLSLVRTPDGIKGQRFFQRHAMAGMSALIDTVKVRESAEPYLVVRRQEALAALAQIAAVELHPWGATIGDIERPDLLVFDLDPAPGVTFTAMVKTALEIRERLAEFDLAAYPKLSGGKGFHVVVPVKPKATWKQAKAFARALVEEMEKDSPERYTTTLRKDARKGRIFLDYLRNDKTSTAIAPWSPRARDGAPIALPIDWKRLEGKRTLPVYTIKTVAKALKDHDPWKRFDADRQPIPTLD